MWIIPTTSQFYRFVPATEDSNSDCIERWADHCELLRWRSKPSLRRTWLQRLKKVSWLSKLCTRTLEPSRQSDFLGALTLSLRAFRASRSVRRDCEKAPRTKGTSGRISNGQSMLFDLSTSSLKTSPVLSAQKQSITVRTSKSIAAGLHNDWELTGGFTSQVDSQNTAACRFSSMCSTGWRDWVTSVRREYSQRRKSARRTDGNGCSSWPTIRASDGQHGGPNQRDSAGKPALPAAVHWATPRANDAEKRGEIANDPRNGLPAQTQWPTPNCRDCTREVSIKHDRLPDRVRHNTTGKNRGQLNPAWVEQLMGLPAGWTNFDSWPTG